MSSISYISPCFRCFEVLLWDCCCLVSKLCLTLVTPWPVAHQVSLSIRFLRQEHWSGFLFPSPERKILTAQELNPCLLWILYCPVIFYQGSPTLNFYTITLLLSQEFKHIHIPQVFSNK